MIININAWLDNIIKKLEEKFDKRIQRVISVAAFRNSKNYERDEGQEKKAGNELPEQIYVF